MSGYLDVDDRKDEQLNKFKEFLPQLVEKLSHMSTECVLPHYRIIALSYKSVSMELLCDILILYKDDSHEILNSSIKRCTIVYKQNFNCKLSCTVAAGTSVSMVG